MAEPKKSAKTPVPEPVNSEQLEAREAETPAPIQAPGPTTGELEERTVEAEDRAAAAERQVLDMAEEMRILKAQIAALMQAQRMAPQARPDAAGQGDPYAVPVFDEDRPYGLVVGDEKAAYVQDGHQFSRDRQYLATEQHRGTARAFNPRLVGWVKPRPNQAMIDALEGFRDRN